jgi:hypothetical protein
VIRGYFDDSGKESLPTGQYVCMAGYLADSGFWELFASGWRHGLLQHRISAIHMKDLIHFQGEYKKLGWDAPKRDEALKDFISVIHVSRLIGFGVGVEVSAWKDMRKRHPEIPDVQLFCFARILRMVVDRMKIAAPRDFLNICFDSDPEFSSQRVRTYAELWKRDEPSRPYLSAITFADPNTYLPLQAADLLAWETRKDLIQKSGNFSSTPRWDALFTAMQGFDLDYQSELWTADYIRESESEILGT